MSVLAQNQDGARERLDEVRQSIEQDSAAAEALARQQRKQAEELDRLRTEMRVAAQAVQTHEAALDSLEAELALLESDATRKQVQFESRRAELGDTLAALQRLALRPTAALLVSPGDPNDVVRSGLLLRTAVPEIERQARVLRADIEELNRLQAQIRTRRDELRTASIDLARDRDRLKALSDSKNTVLGQTETARRAAEQRVAALREEARTLEDLLSTLRDGTASAIPQPRPRDGETRQVVLAPSAGATTPSIAAARGQLSWPAHGTVTQRFGARTEAGTQARGVTWRTRPDASVVAPWDGRIVFAGPFRRFGQILIIDHGEGYHSLIAGLGRIDAQSGQWVLAGEPVGTTGTGASGAPAPDGGATSGGRANPAQDRSGGPTLYVEFRHDGEPINPLPWMAAQTNRTQG
ncbi:MAG: peptidoglycan DD-metalloendopeptidase family protein [Alphaproteobacteria bacterium]|nr:peptidoglycan DD-metalloendopeptidase family protein [Alphaproteobacteria bacterium]